MSGEEATTAARAPRRWHPGVRVRTTVLATAVVAVAVVVAAVALEMVLSRALVSDIDQVAELRASALAQQLADGILPQTVPADDDEAVQVVTAEGRVVAASSSVVGRPPVSDLLPGADGSASATIQGVPGLPGAVRLLALRAPTASGIDVVYVATDLKHADATIVLLQRVLFVAGPLLVLLVGLITWLTVGRALRPVEEIRAEVARITRADLSRRVPVGRADDEIARLARTMNESLSRLEEAVSRQQRFVADSSHELRSPLAALRADLEVSLRHPGVGDWQRHARAMLVEVDRLGALIDDLLVLARSDEALSVEMAELVDMHEVVVAELARSRFPPGVQVDALDVEPALVGGLPDDLGRVVRNLVDNAVEHAQGRVEVSLRVQGGDAVLDVDDDGPGVAPEARAQVFERFRRLDEARDRRHHGTGLGLAIVDELVRQAGGSVQVTDSPLGGARFQVELPVAPAPAPVPAEAGTG